MPGLIDGLFAGRAGIQSHGIAISVLADNIANSNTVAFKASRPEFTDLLAGNIGGGGGGLAVGSGSQINAITPIFSQGSFENTGRALDTAIDGNGFFILNDTAGQRFYSRAGNFRVDSEGNLLNQNGLQVLGFPASGAGGLEALDVNNINQSSVSTANVEMSLNLDVSSAASTLPGVVTFANLASDAQFSTFVELFDSLGQAHTATVYFFHSDPTSSEWEAYAYVDGNDIAGGVAGTPELIGSITPITFDANGQPTVDPVTFNLANVTWSNGATPSNITVTLDPMTQYAAPSTLLSVSQDGTGSGNVVSFSIESNGTLFALLDNGQTSSIGRIALATFANSDGLRRQGDSLYSESAESGEPVVGAPGTGRFGSLASEALELSNSDLASDFIKLISYQRGFQGSSRMITAINDLFNELINLA